MKDEDSPLLTKSSRLAKLGREIARSLRSSDLSRTSSQIEGASLSVMNNVSEAQFSESRKDFIHKLKVAQKEVNEGRNIARTLSADEGITPAVLEEYLDLSDQIGRMLTSSITTATKNLKAREEKKDKKPKSTD